MFPVYEITEEQAQAIIQIEEDYLHDIKAKEIKPAKLSETVSAFANAGGGDIHLGVDEGETRCWRGFSNPEEANDIVQALLQAHTLGNHILFEFLQCGNCDGYVLHITVRKVKEVVRSTKGEIFIRVNAGKIKVDTDDKLRQLELDKGITTFEDEFVDVDLSKIENSYSIIEFMINVVPTAEPLTYLNNQELVRKSQAKVVGVLLFCDEPAVYLAKRCSVKLMRYKTGDNEIGREFLDGTPLTIEGDAYKVIYSCG